MGLFGQRSKKDQLYTGGCSYRDRTVIRCNVPGQ